MDGSGGGLGGRCSSGNAGKLSGSARQKAPAPQEGHDPTASAAAGALGAGSLRRRPPKRRISLNLILRAEQYRASDRTYFGDAAFRRPEGLAWPLAGAGGGCPLLFGGLTTRLRGAGQRHTVPLCVIH